MPSSISAMPVATSLTRGSEQSRPCSSASAAPAQAASEHADPGRAAQVGAAEAGHRRQHQHAFEAEVDAARLLGQAFAEADEQERHADAQRAADDRGEERHEDVAGHAARSFAAAIGGAGSSGSGVARWRQRCADGRPVDAAQRLAGQDQHEGDALQHLHRRVGQAEAALQQAAGGAEAAEQDRDRDDRERVLARDEGDQDAGVAVAGDQRRVGVGVHRRDLDRAGQAGAGAAERAGEQDQPARRQADELRGARVAADHAHREAARREGEPEAERRGRRRRRARGPSARRSRRCRRSAAPRRASASRACSASPDRAAALRPAA